ncbi:MAG: ABC transporter ATP-binding protein [Ruminococcaceae bacterium]|nr:ABC transporter ATP-binding protein [Oscillospiraceae bacterium]
MSAFLSVDNIQLIYQTPQQETMAVKDVSFDVNKGQFVSLVGPSGCGKSTILSCIAGLQLQQKGSITFDGRDISHNADRVGYMLQSDNLLPWRSVWRNVIIGLEIQKKLTEENINYVKELLEKYDLLQFKDSFPNRLSGGMRQRVALIRTLALKPQLLLLDEAFSALDYQTRVNVSCDVYSILRRENKTMVMVTHDIPEAVSMSDKVIVLSKRPAVVAKTVDIDFGPDRPNPIEVRRHPKFQQYFNTIWKELVQ